MYKLFDMIRAVRNALMPYNVVVYWSGKKIIHKAWNIDDAMSWMKCYPNQALIDVVTRSGKIVANRNW